MRQWKNSDRHEVALLRGLPLAEAESWLAERAQDLNQAEQDYIQASMELKLRHKKSKAAAENCCSRL